MVHVRVGHPDDFMKIQKEACLSIYGIMPKCCARRLRSRSARFYTIPAELQIIGCAKNIAEVVEVNI
jgi:hypothetical protein